MREIGLIIVILALLMQTTAKEIQSIVDSDTTVSSIEYQIIGSTGYLKIPYFNDKTFVNVVNILDILNCKGINTIALDLRNNTGGDIMESIKIAELFVKKGLIARIQFYSKKLTRISYYSSLRQLKNELMVLVNNNTASAAKLLANTIKDSNSGNVIGGKTIGNSVVQKLTPIITEKFFRRNYSSFKNPTVNLIEAIKQEINLKSTDILGWAKITVGEFHTNRPRFFKNILKSVGSGIMPQIKIEKLKIMSLNL